MHVRQRWRVHNHPSFRVSARPVFFPLIFSSRRERSVGLAESAKVATATISICSIRKRKDLILPVRFNRVGRSSQLVARRRSIKQQQTEQHSSRINFPRRGSIYLSDPSRVVSINYSPRAGKLTILWPGYALSLVTYTIKFKMLWTFKYLDEFRECKRQIVSQCRKEKKKCKKLRECGIQLFLPYCPTAAQISFKR